MKVTPLRMRLMRATLLVGGTSFILSGCDPGIQATVENGIISASQAGLTSFYQALLQLWQEENANSNSN